MDGLERAEQAKPSAKKDKSDEDNKGKIIPYLLKWCSEEHLAYKVFNFFFYGAAQTFNSYVSVYLKTLGLTASHVGLINGTHPLLQVIGAPLAGILGDKYKIKIHLLLFGMILMTIRTMLYLPFQPRNQTCQIVDIYVNNTHQRTISTTRIHYRIMKRSRDARPWSVLRSSKSHFFSTEVKSWTKPQNVNYADHKVRDKEIDLEKNVVSKKMEDEIDPFKAPTNVVIKQVDGHKLIYIKNEDKDEIYHIFVILLCITMFGEVFEAFVTTISDTCCLDYLGDKRESFGLFRFWGALGASITSPLCGVVFDYFAVEVCGKRISGYHFVFYFYVAYMCVAFISSTQFQYRYDTTATASIHKNISDTFWNLRYGIFLFASLYMGLCYGFFISFSFWFLDDLGANATLLGVASSLRSVSENCVYYFSPVALKHLGHVKIASGCLLAFSISFISYSFVRNPWVAIPLEILYTAAYAFAWTTSVSYMNKAAPPGSSTMIQGIVQASFWGLGFGSGSIIGGFSFRAFGNRETFRGFAVISFIIFLIFVAVQLILVQSDRKTREPLYNVLESRDDEGADKDKK